MRSVICYMLILLFLSSHLQARYLEDFNRDGQINSGDILSFISTAISDRSSSDLDFNSDGYFKITDIVALAVNIARNKRTEVPDLPGDAEHRGIAAGEIPVSAPGYYGQQGASYVLTRNISCSRTAIFLGPDVTLDLNGYTVTFADTAYEHVQNYGFEQDLEGWDITSAPGARIRDTKTYHTFIDDKILQLPRGEEIASSYINLPVANRTYYAMCGVASQDYQVTINVDDEQGNPVNCVFTFGSTSRTTCPESNRSPQLGGGFVFAQLKGLPAGRYRIRVKAETDCLIDHVDIRPAMDVGIAIVDNIYPWSYYKSVLDGDYTAFTDYHAPGTTSTPADSIPRVSGIGTITIKNGVIKNGFRGIRTWGIQSTASNHSLFLENLRIENSGISANAVEAPQAVIRNCRFEIDCPFVITRHGPRDHSVHLRGSASSEVHECQFIGGQGCLSILGSNSIIQGNRFENHQMVTNHYSIQLNSCSGVKVYDNDFVPLTGSGILCGSTENEIYNNYFRIETSPPTCEYGNEDYSVNAIRITDYNAPVGSADGAYLNRIHDNVFEITARDYSEYQRGNYLPLATAVFLSVGAGRNYFEDNTININNLAPDSPSVATAFYIGGSNNGGEYSGNTITSNVPHVWVATYYGSARDAVFKNNTFISAENAPEDLKPVRLGWQYFTAQDLVFQSNTFEGIDFDFQKTLQNHSYKVYWTLTVNFTDQNGNPLAGSEVVITDKNAVEAGRSSTDNNGRMSCELLEYEFSNGSAVYSSPYTVKSGGTEQLVTLDRNMDITIIQQ